jgi:hypothetical protein
MGIKTQPISNPVKMLPKSSHKKVIDIEVNEFSVSNLLVLWEKV